MGCKRTFIAGSLSVFLGTVSAVAQTPGTPPSNYDPFDYTGTALAGQAGGVGWNGAWFTTSGAQPNSLSNDSTSLSYPVSWQSPLDPPASVGARISTGGTSANASSSRMLASTFDTNVGGNTMFVSALIRKNVANGVTNADNVLLEFCGTDGNRRFGLGIEGTGDKPWLNANGSTSAATSVVAGQTYFLVAKFVAGAGGTSGADDTAYLKVFAADPNYSNTVPFAEPTTWDATLTEKTGSIFDRIRVRIDTGNTLALPGEVDDIRIGPDWQSVAVVPEPVTSGLIFVAGIGLLTKRRRSVR